MMGVDTDDNDDNTIFFILIDITILYKYLFIHAFIQSFSRIHDFFQSLSFSHAFIHSLIIEYRSNSLI